MGRKGVINESLMARYPTKESFERAFVNFDSLPKMAKEIGIAWWSLNNHRKLLGVELRRKTMTSIYNIKSSEVSEKLEKIQSNSSDVTTYKITDSEMFWQDPFGYEGLEFTGIEKPKVWRSEFNAD